MILSDWKMPAELTKITRQVFVSVDLNKKSGKIFHDADIFFRVVGKITATPIGGDKVHGCAGISDREAHNRWRWLNVF